MEIDSLPVRVISRIKCSSVQVEFVAKDQLQLFPIFKRRVRVGLFRGIGVYQSPISLK